MTDITVTGAPPNGRCAEHPALETAAEHYEKNIPELYIETYSGGKFFIDRPEFVVRDIGVALGRMCRYTGHCRQFYSVAEHSVLVSRLVEDLQLGDPLEGLLHDGAEAYLADIAAPWKVLLPDYKKLEAKIDKPLRAVFGLPETMSDGVKRADWLALFIEARSLMPSKAADWGAPEGIKEQAADLHYEIRCFNPPIATAHFMYRLETLVSGRS